MQVGPFFIPGFLEAGSRGIQAELTRQASQLEKLHLHELLAYIRRLRPAQTGCTIESGAVCAPQGGAETEKIARQLIPWRKGPFRLGDLNIDAEWRSEMKWNRLLPDLPDLAGKVVADVGCNNGYYLFQIAAAGATHVVGFDPTLKYWLQHALIEMHTGKQADFLPLGWQALEFFPHKFDVIFLMGVNYHDDQPLEMFSACLGALAPGGYLIVESVVVPGELDMEIFPAGRYAGIGGVFAIPTAVALERQLRVSGFPSTRILHNVPLTPAEQRSSEFSPQQSLADHLLPDGRSKEGYPPPYRAAILAQRN